MATVMPIAQVAREELAGFQGRLIGPDDADYDEARRVYNAMIDKRPAVIARCATVEDVSQAVRFARDRGLPLAVRGGGHNGAGLGTCDDGVVIDLSPAQGDRRRSRRPAPSASAAAATWGEVDRATHPFGLATPSGIISTTGVGGLTLGGGLGHLTRRRGLADRQPARRRRGARDGELVTRQHATRTPTCSGRSAAAAATSASSPRSCSGCTR